MDAEPLAQELKGQIIELKDELAALRQAVTQSDAEIDAIQVQMAIARTPWYRSPALILSLVALLFSLGTTAVSYYRTAQQDLHDARTEIRILLQRLTELKRQNLEAYTKYPGATATQYSVYVNEESTLLAYQAAAVMERIPDQISAIEYYTVADALRFAGDNEKAKKLVQRGVEVAKSPSEELGALRMYGGLLIMTGEPERGREMFRRALQVYAKYPVGIQYVVDYNNADTELQWAQSELGGRYCAEAKTHLENARKLVNQLAPGTATENLKQQLELTQQAVDVCK